MNPDIFLMKIIIGLFSVVCILALVIAWFRTLYKTMRYVPKEKAVFPNAFIWCMLIPFVGFIFEWMMIVFGIPGGLKNTLENNSEAIGEIKKLRNIGICREILITFLFIYNYLPNNLLITPQKLSIVFSILFLATIITAWAFYWIKITNIRKRYFENSANFQAIKLNSSFQKEKSKERSILLILLLLLISVVVLVSTFFDILNASLPYGSTTDSTLGLQRAYQILFMIDITNLIAICMLWMWKKWGFFILIFTAAITMTLVMTVPLLNADLNFFGVILPTGILYLAMKEKWGDFK